LRQGSQVAQQQVLRTYSRSLNRSFKARLRYLTNQSIGAMLVQFLTVPELTPDEFVASLRNGQRDTILPILELYTEALLTSHKVLEDYVREPPGAQC
jgi:hypothetical protein